MDPTHDIQPTLLLDLDEVATHLRWTRRSVERQIQQRCWVCHGDVGRDMFSPHTRWHGRRVCPSWATADSSLGDLEVPRGGVDFVGIWSTAHTAVQRVDGGDLLVVEGEVEHGDVLSDALGVGGLGNDRSSLLEMPAQHDLGRSLAVFRGDAADDLVIEDARSVLAPPGVE